MKDYLCGRCLFAYTYAVDRPKDKETLGEMVNPVLKGVKGKVNSEMINFTIQSWPDKEERPKLRCSRQDRRIRAGEKGKKNPLLFEIACS